MEGCGSGAGAGATGVGGAGVETGSGVLVEDVTWDAFSEGGRSEGKSMGAGRLLEEEGSFVDSDMMGGLV